VAGVSPTARVRWALFLAGQGARAAVFGARGVGPLMLLASPAESTGYSPGQGREAVWPGGEVPSTVFVQARARHGGGTERTSNFPVRTKQGASPKKNKDQKNNPKKKRPTFLVLFCFGKSGAMRVGFGHATACGHPRSWLWCLPLRASSLWGTLYMVCLRNNCFCRRPLFF
jgi:hypothetical protein